MGFLDDLIGYKTVRALDSAPMPQRATLSFEGAGASVVDDPLLEQTVVTFEGGGASVVAVDYYAPYAEPAFAITDAALGAADLVRVTAYAEPATPIAGIDVTALTQPKKTLVNLGSAPLSLLHDAPHPELAPESRFILPGGADLTVQVDQSVDVVYVPARDGITAGWRVIL
jgi:hypothetical protein